MSLEFRVDMNVSGVPPEKSPEIFQNIELLKEQSPRGIYSGFKEKKLDFTKGPNTIIVTGNYKESLEKSPIAYRITYRAYVGGTLNPFSIVGSTVYTQKEVEELKRQQIKPSS
jgi:hypothetical protein